LAAFGQPHREKGTLSNDPFTATLVDTGAVQARAEILDEPLYAGLRFSTWLKIAVLTVLMAATFWINLRHLYLKTNPFTGEQNWGHAVVIPIIGLYYLYLYRDELKARKKQPLLLGSFTRGRLISGLAFLISGAALYTLPMIPLVAKIPVISVVTVEPAYVQALGMALAILGALALLLNWAFATLLFGLFTFAFGIWPGRNDFVRDTGTVITLFGVVLMLCGWDVMRIAWFPIVFLIAMIPWPGLVYSKVAGPLQELAAHVAVAVLNISGVESHQTGTKIVMEATATLPERTLSVAEACAGLKSLMTFISIGAGIAFVFGKDRPLWQKLIITVSAVPIAILCNVMRVAGQGLLDRKVSTEFSEGFAHQIAGLVMLIPAFFLLLGVAWVLDQIFVEEVDAEAVAKKPAGPAVIRRQRTAIVAAQPQAVDGVMPRRAIPRRIPPTAQTGGEGA
jgi:exosortase